MKLQSNRIGWIESLRAIALLMVVVTHFIARFCPELSVLWKTYSFALKGISGKHGVAIFCVLIGFFSSKSSRSSFPTYLIRRYLQFAINILVVLFPFSIVLSICMNAQFAGLITNMMNAVLDALLYRCSMNPTLWCVRDLFFGSLICFVLGNYCKHENKWKELAFILALALFMFFVDVWIAICILGAGLRVTSEIVIKDRLKWIICALCVIAIPLLYRHEESHKTYMLQGISCCLFMYVCMCINAYTTMHPKGWLRLRLLPFIGNISFYMFLWHTPVNIVLKTLDLSWNPWWLFAASFLCSMALSIVQNWMNEKWIIPFYKRIQVDTVVKM